MEYLSVYILRHSVFQRLEVLECLQAARIAQYVRSSHVLQGTPACRHVNARHTCIAPTYSASLNSSLSARTKYGYRTQILVVLRLRLEVLLPQGNASRRVGEYGLFSRLSLGKMFRRTGIKHCAVWRRICRSDAASIMQCYLHHVFPSTTGAHTLRQRSADGRQTARIVLAVQSI